MFWWVVSLGLCTWILVGLILGLAIGPPIRRQSMRYERWYLHNNTVGGRRETLVLRSRKWYPEAVRCREYDRDAAVQEQVEAVVREIAYKTRLFGVPTALHRRRDVDPLDEPLEALAGALRVACADDDVPAVGSAVRHVLDLESVSVSPLEPLPNQVPGVTFGVSRTSTCGVQARLPRPGKPDSNTVTR